MEHKPRLKKICYHIEGTPIIGDPTFARPNSAIGYSLHLM
jgi:hypothetical protein